QDTPDCGLCLRVFGRIIVPAPSAQGTPKKQLYIAVLWPSFLTATIASGLFFSAFDPKYMIPFNIDTDISTLGIYTVGFFVFWALAALSSIGTLYFTLTYDQSTTSSGQTGK
ncbi:MAG: hypothetical protein ACC663_02865, partial [Gammaproteobacteria bacterium]